MRTRTPLAVVMISVLGACAEPTASTEPPVALAAQADALAVEMDQPASLAVADNDLGVDEARTIVISAAPSHGTATLDDAGVLHYQPEMGFLGDDLARYQIANPDGSTSSAEVSITVGCATCAIGTSIKLAWDPNAPSENVLGYRLYLGATEDPTGMAMVDEIEIDQAGFDATMPSIGYDAWADFHLRLGDNVCFRMTAFNAAGESDFSNAACEVVTGTSMRFGL